MTLVVALGIFIGAGACGGGSSPSPSPSLPTPQPFTAVDFRFQPDRLTTAPGQVTLGTSNQGTVTHNFSISSLEVDFDLKPGESTNLIFVAPSAGQLAFFCKFHAGQGMRGTLVVQS